MSRFQPIKRDMNYLLPPSMNDWLPEHHLSRFIVEIVEQLDLKPIERAYGSSGSAAFHPALLLSILVYGYATGVFASRKLENATYDSVAFRFVAADQHPDHDTLNTFRKRFLKEIEGLMVQVLIIARTLGVLNLGNIALDGSKLKANASKHSALSYGHIKKLEEQLQAEVKKLMELAEAADNEKIPDGMNVPEEIARREDRLRAIGEAKAKIEQRAKERHTEAQAEYRAKIAKREDKSEQSGKPPRGQAPAAPIEGARDSDQINLTDEESRIMKVSGGGFEQCYNGQIAVDMGSMLIVNTEPAPLKEGATEMEKMRHLLLTIAGRALYAKRKSTVEPVIGIIKAIPGFRQFSLRGLENVKGELNLVAMAWNLKRMFVLAR